MPLDNQRLDAIADAIDKFNLRLDAVWKESDHPRGQPDNPGQFAKSSSVQDVAEKIGASTLGKKLGVQSYLFRSSKSDTPYIIEHNVKSNKWEVRTFSKYVGKGLGGESLSNFIEDIEQKDEDPKLPPPPKEPSYSGLRFTLPGSLQTNGIPSSMTNSEEEALNSITGGLTFDVINKYLRGHSMGFKDNPDQADRAIEFAKLVIPHIDSLMNRTGFKKDQVLYRGMTNGGKAISQLIGKSIEIKGYVSTSNRIGFTRKFRSGGEDPVTMVIYVPAGSHGIDVSTTLGKENVIVRENEFLLPRGSKFYVESYDHKTQTAHVRLVHQNV